METYKILMIGGLMPWEPPSGGGPVIGYKVSEAIEKEGHEVTYVGTCYNKPDFNLPFKFINCNKSQLKNIKELKNLSTDQFDLFHIHEGVGVEGLSLPFLFRDKDIFYSHYAPRNFRLPRSHLHLYWRLVMHKSKKVFALSNYAKSDINFAYGVKNEDIIVTYSGVDDAFFVNKNNFNKESFNLLFCGRLDGKHQQKGVDILLRAMPHILDNHDVHLTIIGEGNKKNEYVNMAQNFKIEQKVTFKGFIDPVLMPNYYKKFDAFLLPSRTESFGLVLAEAMASGLPVVSTKVGAIPEVVGTHGGILVDPNEPLKFASAVSKILDDPYLMKKYSQNGQKKVLKYFTWKKVAKRIIKTYRESI